MQIRDVSCRYKDPSPTHHQIIPVPLALRGHLHTASCALWIDPLAVTPWTVRLELEKA